MVINPCFVFSHTNKNFSFLNVFDEPPFSRIDLPNTLCVSHFIKEETYSHGREKITLNLQKDGPSFLYLIYQKTKGKLRGLR